LLRFFPTKGWVQINSTYWKLFLFGADVVECCSCSDQERIAVVLCSYLTVREWSPVVGVILFGANVVERCSCPGQERIAVVLYSYLTV